MNYQLWILIILIVWLPIAQCADNQVDPAQESIHQEINDPENMDEANRVYKNWRLNEFNSDWSKWRQMKCLDTPFLCIENLNKFLAKYGDASLILDRFLMSKFVTATEELVKDKKFRQQAYTAYKVLPDSQKDLRAQEILNLGNYISSEKLLAFVLKLKGAEKLWDKFPKVMLKLLRNTNYEDFQVSIIQKLSLKFKSDHFADLISITKGMTDGENRFRVVYSLPADARDANAKDIFEIAKGTEGPRKAAILQYLSKSKADEFAAEIMEIINVMEDDYDKIMTLGLFSGAKLNDISSSLIRVLSHIQKKELKIAFVKLLPENIKIKHGKELVEMALQMQSQSLAFNFIRNLPDEVKIAYDADIMNLISRTSNASDKILLLQIMPSEFTKKHASEILDLAKKEPNKVDQIMICSTLPFETLAMHQNEIQPLFEGLPEMISRPSLRILPHSK